MPFPSPPALGIIGGGRAAWAFGLAWVRAGWPVAGVNLREGSESPAAKLLDVPAVRRDDLIPMSDIVLVAVSDRAIEEIAMQMSVPPGKAVFHASGSLPADVLRHPGAFSIHPFRALPPVGQPVDLAGALLVYEGADSQFDLATDLARRIGARIQRLSAARKPLYHAAAVLAANDVAALLDLSESILREIGLQGPIDGDVAALAETAIVNWLSNEGAARFTGPVVRRDIEVLRRHHQALGPSSERAGLYGALAMEIIQALRRRGGGDDLDALERRAREALELP
jgi:predicted short-subunit dehydrogenase-like oxidoreductase (DUF2520 family)